MARRRALLVDQRLYVLVMKAKGHEILLNFEP